MTKDDLRRHNLALSKALVHNNLGASQDELHRAINDLGDEVVRLNKLVEMAYREGWNDCALGSWRSPTPAWGDSVSRRSL
jgi:hypothetical protein